ncbi:hypothetical protein OS493_017893 [Desmophyllum pertusum]|uniref:Uncharacterized protein n=1 Tax=Desmophyllum pertusum TaxID=174260 RepID=A0A9W9Z033_9CNID|nr:hypothetical protein OS493_017893 [Desmophyllum pertusum]
MRERRRRCCWIYRKLILAGWYLDQRLPALACHESIIEERKSKGPDVHHIEHVKSMQSTFQRQAESQAENMGNPFKETSNDLLVLDARYIADVKVLTTVNEVEHTGSQQYTAYVKERVVEPTKLITECKRS